MRITLEMIEAARRAEHDFYQRARSGSAGRFMPIPDAVIRVMLEAAFTQIPDEVSARKPRPRR